MYQEERLFERKPLFEVALRTAPERRHRTGNALKKAEGPAVLVNMRSRRHRRDGHDDRDVYIRDIDVHSKSSLPSLVVCARVSIVVLDITTMCWK